MARQSPESRRLSENATIREVQFIVEAALAAHMRNVHIPIWERLWRRHKNQRTVADIDKVLDMAAAAAREAAGKRAEFDVTGKSTLLS